MAVTARQAQQSWQSLSSKARLPPQYAARVVAAQGARERKKLTSMTRIQSVALDLFEARGFDAVTVEEIAAASEVSPRSVYRYFGTKEELVLWDRFDLSMEDVLSTALAHPVPLDGIREVVEQALGDFTPRDEADTRRRVTLMMSTPELEQVGAARTYAMAEIVGDVLARGLGRTAADLEVQVFAHAFTGGVLGMLHHWHGSGFASPLREVVARLFEIFEEGLDIVTAPGTAPSHPSARPRR